MKGKTVDGYEFQVPMPMLPSLYYIREWQNNIVKEADMDLEGDGLSADFDLLKVIQQLCAKYPPRTVNGRRVLELCAGGKN